MGNLGKKILSGLFWTYAERSLAQLISLIVTIILARIVTPDEYGVISISMVFITLADTFATSGFGNALIQKKNCEKIDFSTVFIVNTVFSIVIYIILFCLADPIASFYNMDKLCAILRVMAIRIPIASINSVQQAYVSKTFQFKKFFYATLGGTVFSAVLGIYMACLGYGAWALVAQYLSNVFVDTFVLWVTVKWRPSFEFSLLRMKTLFSFGWKILATNLLINIYSNIQDLIIGKKFSSSDLAYSNKGRQFPSLIASNINTSINKVLFPVLSDKQDNLEYIKAITRKSISIGTFLLAPLLLGIAAIGNTFVELILTSKWLPCVPYLRIMCLVFLLQPIQTSSVQAFKALGRSDVYLKLEIIKKIFGVIILSISVFFCSSVIAIFVGCLITELFSTIINMPFNKKYYNYVYHEQLKDIITSLVLSGIMYFLVVTFESLNQTLNLYVLFGMEILIGGLFYIFFSIIIKNENMMFILDFFKKWKTNTFFQNK